MYWHYPHYGNQGGRPGSAVRSGPWKLIEFFGEEHVELYNLETDIGETNDLAEAEPEKVNELKALLHAWHDEVDALFPSPNPAAANE